MHKLKNQTSLSRRLFTSLLALPVFLVVLVLASCTNSDAPKQYKIGLAGPLTGESAQFGVQMRLGAEMAIREINANGGIHGNPVILVPGDDKAVPKEAGIVAQRFAADPDIYAVIGHFNSTCSKAGKPIYKQNQILQISPGSTNVTVAEGSDWTFRNIYRDDFQGQCVARYIGEVMELNTVAIFFDNDDYGAGLKAHFRAEAEKIGLEIVAEEAYNRETADFTPQLTRIRGKNPDILFISGLYAQGALIARQAERLGMDIQLIGADGLLSQELIELGGEAVDGMILSVPFLEDANDPRVMSFVNTFQEHAGTKPDAWAALTYDAVGIVAEAIRQSEWNTAAIRDAVAAMDSPEKGYPGVTGLTYFDENGDCLKPLAFAQVQGGQFVKAEQQLP